MRRHCKSLQLDIFESILEIHDDEEVQTFDFLPTIKNYLRMPFLPLHNNRRSVVAKSSRTSRIIIICVVLFFWIVGAGYLLLARSPELPAVSDLEEMYETDGPVTDDLNGANALPGFKDMIQVLDLPSHYLPDTGKRRRPDRLVIIGDVHGMKEALMDLLDKVNFNKKHDHLILAGDLISKGPDSAGVVDLAMKLGAASVRGNHEDRVLLAYDDMQAEHVPIEAPGPSKDKNNEQDTLEEESFSNGDYKDRALAKSLGEKRMKWLKDCPVILRVGKIGNMGEVVVVHAGLVPGVKLEKQDPVMAMTMRTIRDDGTPSDEGQGLCWKKAWNKYQNSLPKKDRTTVIYGHDSKRGLQIEKHSMGIDTGCLKGGKLTAVVIEGGHSDQSHHLVHVNCKDGRVR